MFPYSGTLKLISKILGNRLSQPVEIFMVRQFVLLQETEQILGKLQIFLHNTLEIHHPQDDSVVKLHQSINKKCFSSFKRFAPNYFLLKNFELNKTEKIKFFCLGGDLKILLP